MTQASGEFERCLTPCDRLVGESEQPKSPRAAGERNYPGIKAKSDDVIAMFLGCVARYCLIQVSKTVYQVAAEKFHGSFPHVCLHKQIGILRLLRQGKELIHK